MPDFITAQSTLTQARDARKSKFEELSLTKERLKVVEYQLRFNEENGYPLDSTLTTERDDLQATLLTLQDELDIAVGEEAAAYGDLLAVQPDHKLIVSNLDDHTPVLLFPVRIETAFQAEGVEGPELWVRIFPDDIAIETHEDQLTSSEINSGQDYWKSVVDDPTNKVNAWDVLSRNFGAERAAWIALQTTPSNLATAQTSGDLAFPVLTPKMDSWSRQPVTRVMPDAFVVTGYVGTAVAFEAQGAPITDVLKVGIDPNNDASFTQQNGDITADPEVKWLINFDAAVEAGMGLKIPINPEYLETGFDRIIVLGIKVSTDKNVSKQRVEELFDSHHYTDGLSLLKQGTCTNNTESSLSGYGRVEFGNQVTHSVERESDLFTVVTDERQKTDGQRLAEALGISYDTLQHIYHSNGYDIRNAMYMNNVLWQATGGYYLRDMLYPAIADDMIEETRSFFINYVRSRGALPSIRSGRQPYGILPSSVMSRFAWDENLPGNPYLDSILSVTGTLDAKWAEISATLPHAAAPMQDSERKQALANILAKSPVSIDYYQRVGTGAGYIWNNLAFNGQATEAASWFSKQQTAADNVSTDTGLTFSQRPRILQTNFLQKNMPLNLPLVVDKPGASKLPAFEGTDRNFIQWLRSTTVDNLKNQDFSDLASNPDEAPPQNLLYRLMRQSLILEYWEAAAKLRGLGQQEKLEGELLNVLGGGETVPSVPGDTSGFRTYASTSRWKTLEDPYTADQTAAEFLESGGANGTPAGQHLSRVLADLATLENLSTSELSLLTSEVIDACTFRLDAWRHAFITQRLNQLRFNSEGARIEGIFLGAYGWVENVKPRGEVTIVAPPTENFEGIIEVDEDNQGYIHAPSINHAVTAALLRSGYISRANSASPDTLAVNLSSERVRMAMSFLEGVRNGQELAALLGYQFEKALHERYSVVIGSVELDKYIHPFREKWPLRSHTPIDANTPMDAVKARNVVNGIDLIRDYRILGTTLLDTVTGFQGVLTQAEKDIIFAELDRLENILDAIGDLAVAEGAFQISQGHPARVNAITDAISKGKNIPEIEVVRTPRTGTSLTNRITLNFNPDSYTLSGGWDDETQRSKTEPVLNAWISTLLSDPYTIKCKVVETVSLSERDVSLHDLHISPIDFVLISAEELKNDDSELSLRIKKYVRDSESLSSSSKLTIDYRSAIDAAARTFYEAHSMCRLIRRIITGARHLTTSDFISPGLAMGVDNRYDLDGLYTRISTLQGDFDNYRQLLQTQLTAFTGTAVDIPPFRQLLFEIAQFGIEQTIYEYTDTTAADGEILKTNGETVLNVMNERWAKANAIILDNPSSVTIQPEDENDYVNNALEIVTILLGKDFKLLPLFMLRTEDANVIDPLLTNGGTLLNDHSGNNYIVDEWFQGVAKVRKPAAILEQLSILSTAMDINTLNMFDIKPVQLPYSTDGSERWMAVKMNSTDSVKSNRVSIAVCSPEPVNPYGKLTGLLIDEWVEVIPNVEETTGVAVHYNQPNSKAPQCLILGVTPQVTGSWQWADLIDMLNETLDSAKKRAVDYENLAHTGFAHLLPGVVFPFSDQGTTIGLTSAEVLGE